MSEDLAATTLVNMGIQKVVDAPTSRAEGAVSSPSDDPNAVDRPIYLRACDRCRYRKTKCDTRNPCAGCKKRGIPCTFTPSALGPFSSEAREPKKGRKRSRQPDDPPRPKPAASTTRSEREHEIVHKITKDARSRLDAETKNPENAHWYMQDSHTFRHAGSTSGLPVLNAVRQQRGAQNDRTKTMTPGRTWEYLQSLIADPQTTSPCESTVTSEFRIERADPLPGDTTEQELRRVTTLYGVFLEITATIPGDLMAALLEIFFRVIHPRWPILHADRFFGDMEQWNDPSHGAMVVAMCMLASRYSSDPRVYGTGAGPEAAGYHWHALFQQFLGPIHRGNLKDCQALFFISQFFCVGKVPLPKALQYFAACTTYCLDIGLHREYPSTMTLDDTERETRRRTGWAIYCLNTQLAAILGRPLWLTLQTWDTLSPAPFNVSPPHTSHPSLFDAQHVAIFNELIKLSSVLEMTLLAVVHRPLFHDSPFLSRVAFAGDLMPSDEEGMREVEGLLKVWLAELPDQLRSRQLSDRTQSPWHSVASENLAGVEQLIELLLGARRLQLALAPGSTGSPGQAALCQPLVAVSKDMVASMIHLGASNLLWQVDMFFAYRLLIASRLLLAVCLSGESEADKNTETECTRALEAVSMILDIYAQKCPAAQWAANTLRATCAMSGVVLATHIESGPLLHADRPMYHPGHSHGLGSSAMAPTRALVQFPEASREDGGQDSTDPRNEKLSELLVDLFNGVPGGGEADAINLLGDSAAFAGTQSPAKDKSSFFLASQKANKKGLGFFQALPSHALAKTLAVQPGLDFVLIDTEHGDITDKDYMILNQFIASSGVSPIIRVPADEWWMVKRVLDSGAHGIMVPMCHNADIARRVVSAGKYPPEGTRGIGQICAHMIFGVSESDYEQQANDNLVTMVQIESREGLQNVEEIAAVPGIDVLFVGPFDLAKSLGVQMGGKEHEEAIAHILEVAHKAGKKASIFSSNGEAAGRRLAQGFDSATVGQDNEMLAVEAARQLQIALETSAK